MTQLKFKVPPSFVLFFFHLNISLILFESCSAVSFNCITRTAGTFATKWRIMRRAFFKLSADGRCVSQIWKWGEREREKKRKSNLKEYKGPSLPTLHWCNGTLRPMRSSLQKQQRRPSRLTPPSFRSGETTSETQFPLTDWFFNPSLGLSAWQGPLIQEGRAWLGKVQRCAPSGLM